jgi:hypothetical protein
MDSISARFIIVGKERGINESLGVQGQIGYQKKGSASYFQGVWVNLNTETSAVATVYPHLDTGIRKCCGCRFGYTDI